MNIITGGAPKPGSSGQTKSPIKNTPKQPYIENDFGPQDLLEVKTTSKTNYKLGKTTIHQKVGEDFEPDKPIMSGPRDERITSPENRPDLIKSKRKSVSS